MSRHREARRSRLLVAAATVALVLVAGGALAGPGPTSSAQAAAPFTVTLSQREGLTNGQLVDVDITMRSDLVAVDATAYLCRPGQAYTTTAHVTQNGGNCPVAVSPSAAAGDAANWRLHLFTGGARARGTIAAGIGTAPWNSTITGEAFALTCGPDNPCALVLRVQARPAAGGSVQQHFDASTLLTYVDDDPLASCGGAAPAAVRSAGADRMLQAWREWTVGFCGAIPTAGGAATLAPLPDEGVAVADYFAGDRDVVYTAVTPGEPGFDPASGRPTVATPVAVNAVVLAAAGGHFVGDDPAWPPTLRRPYDDVRLSAEEIAVLLGRGQIHLTGELGDQVLARNPQLGALYPTVNPRAPFALSSANASTLYMTRYLDRLAGNAWTAGPELGLAPRGVTANLGVPEVAAEPTFLNALSLVSDQSLIDRAVITRLLEMSPTTLGPQWVWTDLATATRLGMTPVSLPNANGEWVAPTPASLAAAVPGMTPGPGGMLAPDVATSAPGAYPLTIVEYALAPAQPLVDASCAARTASQELLEGWLGYVTGPAGQAALPEGFVPLTPALQDTAETSVAAVGSLPPDCVVAPVPPTTDPPDPPPPTGPPPTVDPGGLGPAGDDLFDDFDDDDDFDDGLGGGSGDDNPHGGTDPRESTDEDRDEALEAIGEARIDAPPFAGIASLNEALPPLSLLLIVVATSGAAFLTSGREPPPALRATGRALATGAAATRRWAASPRLPTLRPRSAPGATALTTEPPAPVRATVPGDGRSG